MGESKLKVISLARAKVILRSLLLLLIGRRKYCRVLGDSMLPTIHHGDIIIYRPINISKQKLIKGQVVVANSPVKSGDLIIKRVYRKHHNHIELRGDNKSSSIDSRKFGLVSIKQIEGIVEHIIRN